jgi:hypothetical protein
MYQTRCIKKINDKTTQDFFFPFQILLFENDNAVVSGITGILDMENCSMAHFLQMTPSTSKKMTVFMQVLRPELFFH